MLSMTRSNSAEMPTILIDEEVQKMTNEEAIERLKILTDYEYGEDLDALELAIKALEERPQGDLIIRTIREALKETIDRIDWYHINPHGELVEGAHGDDDALYKAEDIYKAIDSALSYEIATKLQPNCNNLQQGELNDLTQNQAYDKGFITAMKLYARPKGKWKKVKEERCAVDMSGEIATRYKCSECGRTITILPSKLSDYPFCHCGADMRKGGPEE